MALSDADRARFIEILAANVPATLFIEVVREQRLVTDFDTIRKQAPEDPAEARRFIATRVVDEYDRQGRVWQFASALFRRSYLDDQLGPLLAEFAARPPEQEDPALQAALVKRANTLASRELREFLIENEGKVCVVVATLQHPLPGDVPVRLGTGFLVGPDLVLTAYHTLARHIAAGKAIVPSPGDCYALFDYYEGEPLADPIAIPEGAIRVPFATDWLVDSKEEMDKDGLFLTPDPDQLQQLTQRLDFALVRLAQPVGRQTRRPTGGPRRSWVKLPVNVPLALADDDRIIIPQHPQGNPQEIDFGRYSATDTAFDASGTRMRYTTETDRGTSGAPCFNQHFRLVGMHNATFRPHGVSVRKNQAIRIDRILGALAKAPAFEDADAPVQLWNTSNDKTMRVILGRRELLDWIEDAAAERPASRAHRVYAAFIDAKDLAAHSGFGKSYTIEILRAARRRASEPIAVLGDDDNAMPDSVPDFIRALAFQIGIDGAALAGMPERPGAELPTTSPNPDKLRRWASEDVPAWFDRVLAQYRVADPVLAARQRVAALRGAGVAPTAEDTELAAQQPGNTRARWTTAWIVLAGLLDHRMSEEVRDLVAGLIGGRLPEDAVPAELRRLRWVFVGIVPDFLAADQVTRELLDPRTIGAAEVARAIQLLAQSLVATLQIDEKFLIGLIDWLIEQASATSPLADPTRRLELLQRMFPTLQDRFVGITKVDG